MSDLLFGLTEAQIQRLKYALEHIESLDRPPVTNSGRRPLYPSRVLVGLLTDPVSATTSLTGKPKVGTLNIYTFTSTGTVDTGIDETVYNFAPQAATTDRWTICERCSATGKAVITTQFCS